MGLPSVHERDFDYAGPLRHDLPVLVIILAGFHTSRSHEVLLTAFDVFMN